MTNGNPCGTERNKTTERNLSLPFSVLSVSSVVKAFVFDFRRVRRVAVVNRLFQTPIAAMPHKR
jgi:hypothetical protein